MAETRTNTTRWLLLAGFVCLIGFNQATAAISVPLTGAIGGTVRGPGGSPQIGASVILYNHLQRQVGKVLTDEHGEFKLLGLFPAVYSVKIAVAAFVPATRQILVQPGMRSVLNVNLSTLFSSIQFGYPVVDNANIMSEDWKWVLRSAPATRPVLRYVAIDADAAQNAGKQSQSAVSTGGHATVFSDTRGLVNVSAGDGSMNAGVSTQADLGTTFALATSLYGNSLIQFSGNFGYGSATGTPATAFRTSHRRQSAGGTPEASLTARQSTLPGS